MWGELVSLGALLGRQQRRESRTRSQSPQDQRPVSVGKR